MPTQRSLFVLALCGTLLAYAIQAGAVSSADSESRVQASAHKNIDLDDILDQAERSLPKIVFSNGALVRRPSPPMPSFPAFPNPGAPHVNVFRIPVPPRPSPMAALAARLEQERKALADATKNDDVREATPAAPDVETTYDTTKLDPPTTAVVGKDADCRFELDGLSYDLNPLVLKPGQPEYSTRDNRLFLYKLNVCGSATSTGSDCQRSNGMLCQYQVDGHGNQNLQGVLSRWNTAPYPVWSFIDESYREAGVKLTLQNGDDCTISRLVKKTREAVINFPCDKDAGKFGPITVQEVATCSYVFTIPTALSCMDATGGMSFGWIFILILFFASAAYVVGGCAFNAFRSKNYKVSMEHFPNLEFWQDLPALVKDGVYYTWGRMMCYTCRQGAKEEL